MFKKIASLVLAATMMIGTAAVSASAAETDAEAVAQAAGGNGGGKPDMAMAGAKEPEKVDFALSTVKETVFGMIK